jgi:hypothetical protein
VRRALELELSRLHARQVEIVVDQRQQVLAVARDDGAVAQALIASDVVAASAGGAGAGAATGAGKAAGAGAE